MNVKTEDLKKLTDIMEERYKDEMGLLMGNCATYAIALQNTIGGRIVGIAAEEAGMEGFGHVLVEWHDENDVPYLIDATKVIRMDDEASEYDHKRYAGILKTVAEMGFGVQNDVGVEDLEMQYVDDPQEAMNRTMPFKYDAGVQEIQGKIRYHLRQIINKRTRGGR